MTRCCLQSRVREGQGRTNTGDGTKLRAFIALSGGAVIASAAPEFASSREFARNGFLGLTTPMALRFSRSKPTR